MANQIFNILKLPNIDDVDNLNFSGIGQCTIPVAFPTSAVKYFNFEFTTKEEEEIANKYYRNVIIGHIGNKKN